VTEESIQVGPHRLRYQLRGSGTPLVLLPGLMDWSDGWSRYMASLERDFRVVALDPLGTGGSDRPVEPEAYTYPEQVGRVLAVMDAVGFGTAHLWGYSAGGQLGAAVAQAHPQRVLSLTAGGQVPVWLASDPGIAESQAAALLEEGWEGYWRESGVAVAPERVRAFRARVEPGNQPPVLAARLRGQASPYDPGPTYPGPKLCYVGTLEPWIERARAGMARIGARFEAIEGQDHGGAFAAQEVVAPLVRDFIAGI